MGQNFASSLHTGSKVGLHCLRDSVNGDGNIVRSRLRLQGRKTCDGMVDLVSWTSIVVQTACIQIVCCDSNTPNEILDIEEAVTSMQLPDQGVEVLRSEKCRSGCVDVQEDVAIWTTVCAGAEKVAW